MAQGGYQQHGRPTQALLTMPAYIWETSLVTISRGKASRFPCTASDSGIRYAFGPAHMCILFVPYSILGFSWVLFPLLLAKFS